MERDNQFSDAFLVESLTRREYEILSLLSANQSNREIGDQLTIALTTVKWYTGQIYGKLGVHNRRQAVQRAKTLGLIGSGLPKHNLPAQPTPLVGRKKELAEIARLIAAPSCRLLTLTGPGGIGKTRLAIQAAADLIEQKQDLFGDGVYFVVLAPVDSPTAILPAIAEALKFSFYEGNESPRQQLLNYLRQKRFLLVLDNFEHLLEDESAGLIVDILTRSPGTRILVTSRSRLNLQGEQLFPVSGMDTPEDEYLRAWPDSPDTALAYSSIQLFQQRAGQVRPGFKITSENWQPIVQICKLVGGMPLGIELAAAWMEALEAETILAEIENGPDFLETDMYAIPERQRSIRAVFDTSWRLLDEHERQTVRKLSVFRGRFTSEAAAQVCSVRPKLLLALVSKSWVQHVAPARYLMHPLLKAYADQSLQEDPNQRQAAKEAHAVYFCSHLKKLEASLRGGGQQDAITEIENDLEDMQAAWRWAASTGRFNLLDQALFSLCSYYDWRGRYGDGEAMCRMAADKMAEAIVNDADGKDADQTIWAKTLAWCAHFTQDYKGAAALLEQSQCILDVSEIDDEGAKEAQAAVWYIYGNHIGWHDRDAARSYFDKSRTLSREVGDQWREGRALQSLGWIAWTTGAPDKAQPLLEQSLELQKHIGDQLGASTSLNLLGLVARDRGDAHKAQQLMLESLAICEELGARTQIAGRLFLVAFLYINSGKFAEGLARARLSLHIYTEMGYMGAWTAKSRLAIGAALMSMGEYAAARSEIAQALKTARENSSLQDIGMALRYLGELSLVEGSYIGAQEILTESLSILDEIKYSQYRMHLNLLGYAACYQGEMSKAYDYLLQSLEQVIQTQDELLLVEFIPLAALLVMESGEIERAVELYALASRYPLVSNSSWYDDLVGKHIAVAAATLPSETVHAAQKRGESLDLRETVDVFVLELKKMSH